MGLRPNIQGIPWRTKICADVSMSNKKGLLVQGGTTRVSRGGRIDGIVVDYNLDRDGFTSGGLGTDTDGNAFSLHCVFGGQYTNIVALSGHKHCFDILAKDYNRTGTPFIYNDPHTLVSENIWVDNIYAFGFGDDGISTHGARNISGGYVFGAFGRATDSTGNSNAAEVDDFSDGISLGVVEGIFAYRAFECKGHDDAAPAQNISVGEIKAKHCSQISIRHIGHGVAGHPSLGSGGIKIGTIFFTAPLYYEMGTGPGSDVQALYAYAYKDINIEQIHASSDGCADQITTQVVQFDNGAHSPRIGYLNLNDFNQASEALDITNDVTGTVMVGSLSVIDSATDKAVEISNGPHVILGSYLIENSGPTGTAAIYGFTDKVIVGAGRSSGYIADQDIAN